MAQIFRPTSNDVTKILLISAAILPLAVGALADRFGLGVSFLVPFVAYAFIATFAVAARESAASASDSAIGVTPIQ